jgi:octaprenyl-diphosphate synthase
MEHSIVIEEPEVSARRIFSLIAGELTAVETEFARQAQSEIEVIAYIGDYLRGSGGKRVRPALTILSAYSALGDRLDSDKRENLIRMAAVMEFLHTATLVHDDIIDNAVMRRGVESVNSRFGNQTAVLMGDWLYMSAFETSLRERSIPILDILTRVTRKMIEGELIQLTFLGRADINETEYLDIIHRKTAFLFSACCEIGAMLGGGDAREQAALREYGSAVGAAFQLADDLLDFTGTDETLGKPAGVDLLEGKLTLPLIYALEQKPALRARVQKIMREGDYEEFPRAELLEATRSTGSLDRARNLAHHFAQTARDSLAELKDSKYVDALRAIPSYIVERQG